MKKLTSITPCAVLIMLVITCSAACAQTSGFYAYYTRLDYSQPTAAEVLGLIPVNAARTFARGKPDPADTIFRLPGPGIT